MSAAAANTPSSSATILPFAEHSKVARDTRPLRLITCGSVDDGKSTLIGRLLWDTKAVKEDQAATLHRDSGKQNDLGLPDFALLLDGLQAEREQGITIDVAYRYFATDRRAFIVADTPGHEQYTRNMATGASTADLAVLLVDARTGILEQTRRHATIAALMGIRQFVLAVNKIDLTNYDKAGFELIAHEFRDFASDLGIKQITAIPMSALKGENVVLSGKASMPWYEGPTLVETLELATVRSTQSGGFRLPVQRVSRPGESFRGYQGTVAGGSVKPGDSVVVLPSGMVANVKQIVTFDLVRNAAVAGDAVTLVLDRQVDVSRGDMIVSIEAQPLTGLAFDAQIVALQPGGIEAGKRYWLKSASRRQRVSVQPVSQLNLREGEWQAHETSLPMNAIGKVRLSFDETAIFDPYEQNRATGSFILIDPDTNNTVAGGMISAKRSTGATEEQGDRVILSLPAGLAEKLLAGELLAKHRDEIDIRRTDAATASRLIGDLD
ncbi:sulfate adenylyltransferase [Agrobacterium tumefaciens]|jgi:sulfate adenylyltransferase subunit 1|uniref:Sulfate adenylyltransferase subunit 1 n=1 Tax=Agrobacterium fabrum (strain C58 / ATCC 33970) TaxID=176299 RepID=CYSN_AGRFC|nr:sulfate adenylyltransferase subunit CysN [Agrobacterium fabrum]Q8UH69.1 RecName: Full=Sulfate adenylyltransferase subunit 1; AltName: Full=ATP-sulfurylase large subunit; AltName: Full=Sulfate adenylate transferase; Short=SAT [Agrobacterium fabrum str. C58]KEY55217.1 sulfate adenylyltransferase [Agrobacterium tumefaciens]AAK86623.1 sulfate adenylate transferase, subunit 1 [Agrobacterium fabrum str. C58]KJX89228.1 sulfate adenylyltransferase subunit 1 [Agrobacterium tumefaciens]MCX2874348.1 s